MLHHVFATAAITAFLVALPAHAQRLPRSELPRPHRIAILPLQSLRPTKDLNWIGKGAAETLTTKLAVVPRLVMVEMAQLKEVLKQENLQLNDLTDSRTAVRVGKLVAADRILVGTYLQKDRDILFNVRVIDVETSLVLNTATLQGHEDRLFVAFVDLADAVVRSFDKKTAIVRRRPVITSAPKKERITLTTEQREHLRDWGTADSRAFAAFAKGLAAKTLDRQIRWYTKAIELDKGYALAFNNRGLTYSRKSDHDRAIRDLNQAIRLNPRHALAFLNRGVAYGNKGDNNRAMRDFNEAIRLDRRKAHAFYNRGLLYGNKGDHGRAIRDFNEAIRLNPRHALAFTDRGTAYTQKGDNDRGIRDFSTAIRLNPRDAIAFMKRGIAYSEKGDKNRALRDCSRAVRLNPRDAKAFMNRGTPAIIFSLLRVIPKVDFTNVFLEHVMIFLEEVSGIPIEVRWRRFQGHQVFRTSEVNVKITNAYFGEILQAVLDSVKPGALEYRVEKDRIVISEKTMAREKRTRRRRR